jgi:AmmeMemoRadiSam system protein B
LGPSHHVYLDKCAISTATICETPLGDLTVDTKTVQTLLKSNIFEQLSIEQEEEEHSLEMHMPWVAKTFDVDKIKVVPIMVGHVSRLMLHF